MYEPAMDQTITVLTVDLVPNLADRLKRAGRERNLTLRDIALEALEEWLERYENEASAAAD